MQADFETPHSPGPGAAPPSGQAGQHAQAVYIRPVAAPDPGPLQCCKVLTVFAARRHRELVQQVCHAAASGNTVVDVASATDAVLTLLAQPVDLVLVDADLAGDLLGALQRHAHRSAPHAKFAVFGGGLVVADDAVAQRGYALLPWTQLEETLRASLAAG
jgi:hypothetical protein